MKVTSFKQNFVKILKFSALQICAEYGLYRT